MFFFFFQAEDGIRDWSVTGVQTCALPIYRCRRGSICRAWTCPVYDASARRPARERSRMTLMYEGAVQDLIDELGRLRSEERRVGKECRAWWMACLSI